MKTKVIITIFGMIIVILLLAFANERFIEIAGVISLIVITELTLVIPVVLFFVNIIEIKKGIKIFKSTVEENKNFRFSLFDSEVLEKKEETFIDGSLISLHYYVEKENWRDESVSLRKKWSWGYDAVPILLLVDIAFKSFFILYAWGGLNLFLRPFP